MYKLMTTVVVIFLVYLYEADNIGYFYININLL